MDSMPYSKSFPKGKSSYPNWEEVFLTDSEEKIEEVKSRNENIAYEGVH